MVHSVASSLAQTGIHRLPNEILSYVFLNAIQVCDDDDYSEAAFFPLTISHTCSRWRKVSISTGSLWKYIRLCLPCSSNQLIYLNTWLTRSKFYPLEILLDFRDPEWGWEEEHHIFTCGVAREIISVILPHAKRWRHIEFFTDTWAPIHAFLNLTRDVVSLPVLRSMALYRCNAYFARKGEYFKPVEMREALQLFGGASFPALRDLSLVGVHVDWQRSILSNLFELELKFHAYDVMPTIGEFAEILESCPDLRRLSIVGSGPRLEAGSTNKKRVISLAKLTRLIFGFVDVEYAVMLLSLFHLPCLREFELEDVAALVDPVEPSDASALLALLEASSTNFHSQACFFPLHKVDCLELRSIRSSETVFSQFLRCFTSLERINLSDVDSALLNSLGPQHLAPCPQLVDLTCRHVDTSILSSVISARAKAGSGVRPLQSVQLELNDEAVLSDLDKGTSTASCLSDEDRNSLLNAGVNLIINDHRFSAEPDDFLHVV
ncbi:hypothetical protein J3R30DRAFT_3282806 [Lentinula aciculospora]|uniref:F-box domain-containing protein n=1 Tax=Lentinula aciculospora TaxID=153920 RepID=A0A9W9AMY3_9AGAR|nr:hypothetical protein J3R30DRAFT_3282806 [Lentinula aciculospora]